MASEIRLTPTSYIVLGLLEAAGEATPYDLKQMVAVSLGNFWTLQHAQLYTEPERLGWLPQRAPRGARPAAAPLQGDGEGPGGDA